LHVSLASSSIRPSQSSSLSLQSSGQPSAQPSIAAHAALTWASALVARLPSWASRSAASASDAVCMPSPASAACDGPRFRASLLLSYALHAANDIDKGPAAKSTPK
jgi:hypothetical protein